ncbi:site-specific integrase [Xanthobacter sp. VTT E-85241]|uniref:tyrosine-type recombinase/integrase n=1 Tax=Roseixanthobacter finlandensis TaxID=3119922 RepID=UPI003726C4FD
MGRYDKRQFQLGEWFLGQRGESPAWYRCRYNAETKRTERFSLGTTDLQEAEKGLTEWFIANVRPQKAEPASLPLADVLLAHWERHAKKQRSAPTQKMSLAYWNEHFGAASVAEATSRAARDWFVAFLEGKGMKPSTVARVISVGKAALRAAWEYGEIASLPPFKNVDEGDKQPRGRPLSVDEIRKLLKHASGYMHTYIMLLAGTGARPEALLQLTWERIDLETGIITLNPPGRAQTKKRRPTIRICEALRLFLVQLKAEAKPEDGDALVSPNGAVLASVKTAWRTLRANAGFGQDVQPTSFRHTVARWMRANSVPPWEVAAFLGHRMPGYNITEVYAHADPAYMAASREALQKLVRAIYAPARKRREPEKQAA